MKMFIYLLAILLPMRASALDLITKDSTDVSIIFKLMDTSSAVVSGQVYSGINAWYRRDGATKTALTPVTGGGLTTHLDNSLTEIDSGTYEYDFPDAAFASGARGLTVCIEDSDGSDTDFVPACERVVLTDPLPANFEDFAITASTGEVSVDTITTSALADMFNTDSGTTYGSAVSGSVVKEIADNTTATVNAINAAGAADLFTVDSGETYSSAVAGSVVKEMADNAAGGSGGGTSMCGNMAAWRQLALYSGAGVTSSTVTGDYVSTPQKVGPYYLKIDATENSSGGVTVTVVTSETNSGAGETVHTVALTATGVTRVALDAVSGQKVLGRYMRVELSTLTGDWDVDVTLEYAGE